MSTYFELHNYSHARIVKEVTDYCDACGQVEWLCICKEEGESE